MTHKLLRIIALLLASAMLLSAAVSAASSADEGAGDFAVENGLLFGRDGDDLCLDSPATRAELAAMLCRLYGLRTQGAELACPDCVRGAWYYHPMAAAVGMGFFQVNPDGAVCPEAELSRADAGCVFARAFCLQDADPSVLRRFVDRKNIGEDALAAMAAMVQAGVFDKTARYLRPNDPITRRELAGAIRVLCGEIVHDGDALKKEYGNVLLCSDAPLPKGTVIHGDLLLGGNAPQKLSLKDVQLEGKALIFGSTELTDGMIPAAEVFSDCTLNAKLKTLKIKKDGVNAVLNGSAEQTKLLARHAALSGSGSAGQVINYGVGSKVTCDTASYTEQIDAGLDGLKITQTCFPIATRRENTVELTVHFSEIDTENLYGVEGDSRVCTLNWYLGGELVKSVPDFCLKKGATESAAMEIPFDEEMGQTYPACVQLVYRGETAMLPLSIRIDNSGADAYYEALSIPTAHVLATMRYSCTAANGTPLDAGDTVYFMGGSDYIQIPGGRFTFVPVGSFEIIDDIYYDSSVEYSREVAEAFVNEVHDYSGDTGYLIWCSLYSQHVFVFSGSQGNWELQCSGMCASGKNYSPTRPGEYKIYSKEALWDFGGYIVEHPCAFDADVAFHSVTKFPGGGVLDPTLGTPVSHGCVRLPDEVIDYIYENCAIGTTVVVW